LQFAQEHDSWYGDQWARILFVDETCICHAARVQIWIRRSKDIVSRSQFMVQGHSNFALKIGMWACMPVEKWAIRQCLVIAWTLIARRRYPAVHEARSFCLVAE
jgi:hypothetical protein